MASLDDKKVNARSVSRRLRIELLGPFRIFAGGRPVSLDARKSRAIIASLAMSEGWTQPRERFHGLLWSESDSDRARASLRTAIYDIRGVFDDAVKDAFRTDKHTLWLDSDKVAVDLWEALEGAKAGVPTTPLLERERVTENILSDCESVDPSFRDWLIAKRQSLHTRLVVALEDSLRRFPIGGSDPRIEPLARAITRLDPTHEEAARALIRARALAGDLGGAFAIYKALWDLLDTEFEIPPSKETQDLIAELRLAQPDGTAPEPAAPPRVIVARDPDPRADPAPPLPQPQPAARKLVINVGGFDAGGVHPDHRNLISLFRKELSACLIRFREWSVRDQEALAAGAVRADSQDGEYTLDASAFETSDGVRLVLMLRDASTNDYIWSERLVLSTANWFDTQQTIVRRLATAMSVHVSAERLATQARLPDKSYGAFDQWLKAQALLSSREVPKMEEALRIGKELIATYPNFAPAYLQTANYLNIVHINIPGMMRDRERTAEALRHAREAVRLDPVNSRSQLCLAWSHVMAGQAGEAQLKAALALELNENDAWTRVSAAHCWAFAGVTPDLMQHIDRLNDNRHALTPLQWGYQAITLFLLTDYAGCIDAATRASSSYYMTDAWKAAAQARVGDFSAARTTMQVFLNNARAKAHDGASLSLETISAWFLQAHPICRAEDLQRLKAGVAGAGLPVA